MKLRPEDRIASTLIEFPAGDVNSLDPPSKLSKPRREVPQHGRLIYEVTGRPYPIVDLRDLDCFFFGGKRTFALASAALRIRSGTLGHHRPTIICTVSGYSSIWS